MDSHPKENKRRKFQYEAGSVASVIVHVFDGMHAQTGKGFNVRIAMMERMNVLVHEAAVNHSMAKVEMDISIALQQDGSECCLNHCRSRLEDAVKVGNPTRLITMQNSNFRHGPLKHSQPSIEYIVAHLGPVILIVVGTSRTKGPCAPVPPIQRHMPKSDVTKGEDMIDQETLS